jgi:hypothetical protein
MVKRIIILLLCFISCSTFAVSATSSQPSSKLRMSCPQAPVNTSGDFCNGFKASGYCHCDEKGMDAAVCEDMNQVYSAMMGYFSNSLDEACQYGEYEDGGVPKQVCIDDWNCYRNGGVNPQGGLCNSTGAKC